MGEQVVFFANHGMFGGAANLVNALNSYSRYECSLFTHIEAPYEQESGLIINKMSIEDFHNYAIPMIEKVKKFFICDYQGLEAIGDYLSIKNGEKITHKFQDKNGIKTILNFLSTKQCIFFWSGTRYKKNHKKVNSWVELLGVKRTYSMPDLRPCDPNALPLYQPFEFQFSTEKFTKFTICHSPGDKLKGDSKGTAMIMKALEKLKVKYDINFLILKHTDYQTALGLKSKCHLFIDQITKELGGVGKSGLEAIRMGIPVLSDVKRCIFDGYYADHPIINVSNSNQLFKKLEQLINSKSECVSSALTTLAWGERLSYGLTANYLNNTMIWE